MGRAPPPSLSIKVDSETLNNSIEVSLHKQLVLLDGILTRVGRSPSLGRIDHRRWRTAILKSEIAQLRRRTNRR